MSTVECCWLGWEGVCLQTRRFRVRVCAPPKDVVHFTFFLGISYFFNKDYDIIGKLWTYHNDSTQCYIKGLTYDIIVHIIVNIIYDIIGMILIMISYIKI
jgi:hypothetical protein